MHGRGRADDLGAFALQQAREVGGNEELVFDQEYMTAARRQRWGSASCCGESVLNHEAHRAGHQLLPVPTLSALNTA